MKVNITGFIEYKESPLEKHLETKLRKEGIILKAK